MTPILAGLILAVLAVVWFVAGCARRDPVDDAYDTLPAGRPDLYVDTRTGSHDTYPHMSDTTRDVVIAYCEGMWAQPTTEEHR